MKTQSNADVALLPPLPGSDLRQIMDVNRAKKAEAKCRNTLMRVRDQLERLAKELHKSAVVEYTGDFVLLRRDGAGWEFVAIYNPDTWEGEEPEWDQCMPIPKLETIPEFDGW